MKTRRHYGGERRDLEERTNVCLTGTPNDISYKNNTHIPGISVPYVPKDVVVRPKWTSLDRRHQGNFYSTMSTNTYQWSNQGKMTKNPAKKNADYGACSHTVHNCSTFFSADILRAKNGELLNVVYFTRLSCTYTPCLSTFAPFLLYENLPIVFPSYFNYRNTSILINFQLLLELSDILLPEQCEISGGY